MLTLGPIEVPKNPYKPPKTKNGEDKIKKFALFYIILFSSWQIANIFILKLSAESQYLLQSILQFTYLTLFLFFIVTKSSDLRRHGYGEPRDLRKQIICSLLIAVVYNFAAFFASGFFVWYYVFPSPSSTELSLIILLAIITGLTNETIFRGYLQTELAKKSSVFKALFSTSSLFAAYRTTLFQYNLQEIILEFLYFSLLAIFLGVLFLSFKTIFCPILSYSMITILSLITPIKPIVEEPTAIFFRFVGLTLAFFILKIVSTSKHDHPKIYMFD
jgi:membrane protease YdiL (CAAX protease family)